MKIYDAGRAPNPRRVRIFLAEKGIIVPLVPIDLNRLERQVLEHPVVARSDAHGLDLPLAERGDVPQPRELRLLRADLVADRSKDRIESRPTDGLEDPSAGSLDHSTQRIFGREWAVCGGSSGADRRGGSAS